MSTNYPSLFHALVPFSPRYVRLSDDSDPQSVYSLLRQDWGLLKDSPPALVVKFFGGDVGTSDVDGDVDWRELAQELSDLWTGSGATVLTRGLETGFTRVLTQQTKRADKRVKTIIQLHYNSFVCKRILLSVLLLLFSMMMILLLLLVVDVGVVVVLVLVLLLL